MTQQLSGTFIRLFSSTDPNSENHIATHLFMTCRSKEYFCTSSMILLTLALQLTSRAAKRWGRLTFRGEGVSIPTRMSFLTFFLFKGHTSENHKAATYESFTFDLWVKEWNRHYNTEKAVHVYPNVKSSFPVLSWNQHNTGEQPASGSCKRQLIG